MTTTYKDYFQIDENYFPCVNESAINAGLKWDAFYPHSTFIDLLKKTERVLSRQEKRSLWISGAYGTGKSYAAFALGRLLTASTADVEAYFSKYDALAVYKTDLLPRLITAKNKGGGILTCYRYASATIENTNDLIIVIQGLIARAVEKAGLKYKGEMTLKQSILEWLKDERNKQYFSGHVEKEYKDLFGGWDADEIIAKLSKDDASSDLVGKINKMASEIGVSTLKIDMDGLIAYIKDIIAKNNLNALVFVLDEFSEFFQNNRYRLTDFQKLVETCAEVPFYLMVVAHQMGSYFHERDSDAKKIKDRFLPCEISMPDNIAFDLMSDALKIKDDAKLDWEAKLDDLQDFTKKSRKAVSECTQIKEGILKRVLPLHPMSALLLKHISSAFESNQRSMFDFIKNDDDYKAFQWFIDNHGPLDGTTALLTVDMLWDFFYETGKDNLALPIRNILDNYKKAEAHNLMPEEYQVLKSILIMQAVSTHLNDAIPLFITNSQNLYLCFEGTDYEHKAPAIADKLVREEVLFKKQLGNNKYCWATINMGGDAAELDKKKKDIIEKLRTQTLCIEDMTKVFTLTPPLKMRYDLTFAAEDDINSKTNRFVNEVGYSGIHAIVGVAKDDNEAVLLRKLMQDKIVNVIPDDKNIIYIDTTPTPFGSDSIDQYAEYMASSEILRGNDKAAADDMLNKGKMGCRDWGNRIYNGQLIIYSKNKPEGERYANWQMALNGLRDLVKGKYPYTFEFTPALSEATLQTGSKPQWVEAGITEKSGGQTASAEKIVNAARRDDEYWISDPYSALGVIKNALDKKIKTELTQNSKIAIKDMLEFLCDEYGFVPSNLYCFITGFLLKEYAVGTYRLSDGANNEKMTADKLKEVIDEGFKQSYAPSSRYRDKFIRIMSHEDQLFCGLMREVFDIPENQCGSVEDAIKRIRIKAKSLGLPVWVLKEKACGIEVDFITELVKLLNPEQGTNIAAASINIGKLIESDDTLAQKLKTLVTPENCRESMLSYLSIFEDGKLLGLAKEIGAVDKVVGDIQKHFGDNSEGLWLWDTETGDGQIRKVIREYEFIKTSNNLLIKHNSSIADALSAWQDKLKFIKVSFEVAHENHAYTPFIGILVNIAKGSGRDTLKASYDIFEEYGSTIIDFLKNDRDVFTKAGAFLLQGLSEQELTEVYNSIPNNCFVMNKQDYLQTIQQIVNNYKSNLAKMQLRNLWKEKTGTDFPHQWSTKYKTPIIACVPDDKWSDFKRAFGAVNRKNPDDSDVKFALEFFKNNAIWDDIANQEKIDKAFIKVILGSYKSVLTDLNEVRDYLSKKTSVPPYDWIGHIEINKLIKDLAQSKYGQEPFERVMKRIDSMDGDRLKEYLKRLVKGNMIVGIEILEDGEEH
ncbi:hypothetical protein FACS1894206_07920 [Deltaproteobacteria bacterium]|nr:hypothetical protein FACS1894206_07920 [Deltaproteobacteria bacterium]